MLEKVNSLLLSLIFPYGDKKLMELIMNIFVLGSYAKALVLTTDRIPTKGETLIGSNYRETWGGKGSDIAVQAARLGAKVFYSGVVGNDAYGKEFQKLMNSEHIDLSGLDVADNISTGVGMIIKDKNANNIIVVNMGANELFSKDQLDKNINNIQLSDVVIAQLEISLETALYGLKLAKKFGKKTILNPAPACNLIGKDLSFVDYITPNETEAKIAAGLAPDDSKSHREVANILLTTKCKAVVMTLGESGSAIFTKSHSFVIPPCKVNVVDSNGAGDSFNAALSVALGENRTIQDAVYFANATAALCCTKWETVPSYHTREQVNEFIKQQQL